MNATLFTALLILVPAPKIERPQNPLRGAKAGDWVEYTMVIALPGQNMEGRMRLTVTAIGEKEATIETTGKFNGTDIPGQKQTIDLTKTDDPTLLAGLGQNNAKVEKVGEGKEKITHRGKEYDCVWVAVKLDVPGGPGGQELKLWLHKDVPLFGALKIEMKTQGIGVTMELAESGKK